MKKTTKMIVLFLLLILVFIIFSLFITLSVIIKINVNIRDKYEKEIANIMSNTENIENEEEIKNDNFEQTQKVSDFDLKFLKFENQKENKVYSPLSIKYGLKMLEEAAIGETKTQISQLVGNFKLSTYNSNENLSFANSLFIRESFKGKIKEDYITLLKNKYNAEIKFDLFENAENINNWINEKTYNIIPNIIEDESISDLDFVLINALAIDMEWEEKFIMKDRFNYPSTQFLHEKSFIDKGPYSRSSIDVYDIDDLSSELFNKENEKLEVSGMHIEATINNYDIVNELGEENIKQIVGNEYRKFAKGEPYDEQHAGGDFLLSEDTTDEGIENALDDFFLDYISELNDNYHKSGTSTDFSIYVDEDVKIFAKDLREYDGTRLQYVGIMPISKELDKFISDINSNYINYYISNLKDINYKNFEEGVVTVISGYIPKFKFEYNLNLLENLKLSKVTNVFDDEKSNLNNMINGDAYISTVLHKANIEFTQDGIKAAAATFIGGCGAGAPFNYSFDVPIKKIDITFDKPYMFLIRDKYTGEIWFVGTVYEPLLWENENTQSH